MMFRSSLLFGSVFAVALAGCGGPSTTEALGLDPPDTIDVALDLERYDGLWFEVARFENTFQEGCTATTAEYTQLDDGQIGVLNRCRLESPSGDLIEANGVARAVDLSVGKLEVSFFGPFFSDYWVLELGDAGEGDYFYSVVADPGRDVLWILSREPSLPETTLDGILERLEAQQFDTNQLLWTEHGED
jgi:apolipoprotein D and lipocalin family protein